MTFYQYGGKSATSKIRLCQLLEVEYPKVRALEKQGKSFMQALEKCVDDATALKVLLEKANMLFNKNFKRELDVKNYLKYIGFKVTNETLFKVDKKLSLYGNLYNTPYSFLVMGDSPINYKGDKFANLKEFFHHYKIDSDKFYLTLLSNKFNTEKAISNCQNDPQYKSEDLIIIENKKYFGTEEVATTYGISDLALKMYLRKGLSPEEAIRTSIEVKNKYKNKREEFPIFVLGNMCDSFRDVADVFRLSELTIQAYIQKYNSISEFIEDYQSKEVSTTLNKRKKYIMSRYDLSLETINLYMIENNNDIDLVISNLQAMAIDFGDKSLLPFREHLLKFGVISEEDKVSEEDITKLRELFFMLNSKSGKKLLLRNYLTKLSNTKEVSVETVLS